MKQAGTTYDPTLAVMEAISDTAEGKTDLLDRSLVQQVGPKKLLDATKKMLVSPQMAEMRAAMKGVHMGLDLGKQNLVAAYKAGVILGDRDGRREFTGDSRSWCASRIAALGGGWRAGGYRAARGDA